MTPEEIILQIEKYEYISFDLFDTLVFRTVNTPNDVWTLVQEEYNRRNNHGSIRTFKVTRVLAEKIARKINKDVETTLNDIYLKIPYSQNIKEELKSIEIDIEVSISMLNTEMMKVVDWCFRNRKKIVITTDMYLPKAAIERILKKHNIHYNYLFVSGEIGFTKANGKLFPYVLKELSVQSQKIVHLGDNMHSDIEMPKKAGIKGLLRCVGNRYECSHYAYGKRQVLNDHLNNFLQMKLAEREPSVAYEIGYTTVGPIVYEICRQIKEYSKKQNIARIAFVAREGYLLEKAYKHIYKEDSSMCTYIRLNKNVLRYPMLFLDASEKSFLGTIPSEHEYSWSDIVIYFDVQAEKNFILKKEDIISGVYHKEFLNLFDMNREKFENQYNLLLCYLRDKELVNNRVLLVNNSINGNGQIMLENIAKKANLEMPLYGVQLTKSKKCDQILKGRVKACLTESKVPKLYTAMFDYVTLLFEHFLFENTGTALKLVDSLPTYIECDDIGEENKNYIIIDEIQKAALDFVDDYKKCSIPLEETAYYTFFDLYLRPDQNEALLLKNIISKEVNGTKSIVDAMSWSQARDVIEGINLDISNKCLLMKCRLKYILSRLNLM